GRARPAPPWERARSCPAAWLTVDPAILARRLFFPMSRRLPCGRFDETGCVPIALARGDRVQPMKVLPGSPHPLGATWDGEGVNFALYSEHAEGVELCLLDEHDLET